MTIRVAIRGSVFRLAGAVAIGAALVDSPAALAQGPVNPADPQSGAYNDPSAVGFGAPYQPAIGGNPAMPGAGQNFVPGPPAAPTQASRPSSWVGGSASSSPAPNATVGPGSARGVNAAGAAPVGGPQAYAPGVGPAPTTGPGSYPYYFSGANSQAPPGAYGPPGTNGLPAFGPSAPAAGPPNNGAGYGQPDAPIWVANQTGPAGPGGLGNRPAPLGASGPVGPLSSLPAGGNAGPAVGPGPTAGPAPAPAPAAGPVAPPAASGGQVVAPKHALETRIADPDDFNGTEIIAWVGAECVLSGDLLPAINEILENNKDRIDPTEVPAYRRKFLEERLRPLIETKLIFADAKRKLPKENVPKIQKQVDEVFEKENVPTMMKTYNLRSRGELEQKLRVAGTSLENQRQQFFERSVASQFIHQQVKDDQEITHDQMLEYYYAHIKEYETAARARWEQIRVRFDRHNTKEEAWQVLATCGNDVMRGVPMSDVAKARSEDSSAADGGLHDWTPKGSLSSKDLDAAIFTLPVGVLSRIIEDDRGLSIVRVVERDEIKRVPFGETQAKIKQKIKEGRIDEQQTAYIERLRKRTPVRTIFDPGTLASVKSLPSAPRAETPRVDASADTARADAAPK